MFVAVIMAGGRGERFWPKSRKSNPKQLLDIFCGKSLIQQTVNLLNPAVKYEDIYVITNNIINIKIKKLFPEFSNSQIISEPMGKNTATAIGVMAAYLNKKYNNPTMLIATADHLIPNKSDFIRHVKVARYAAEKYKALVTFGIKPSYPETGFGYIQAGKILEEKNGIPVSKIAKFHEKPDLTKAKKYIRNSKYSWNSGMFCWTCESILAAFAEHMPDLYKKLIEIEKAIDKKNWPDILQEIYPGLDSIPIDKGVMEKAENALVLKSNFAWNDIGSWVTMDIIHPKDDQGNVKSGNILTLDTKNCIVYSDHQLVATLGLQDLIIVTTRDSILICPKDKAQSIRQIIQALETNTEYSKYL